MVRIFKSRETALAWGAAFAAMAAWSYYDRSNADKSRFGGREEWNKKIKEQEKQRKSGSQ